jgi:hypothetical protein
MLNKVCPQPQEITAKSPPRRTQRTAEKLMKRELAFQMAERALTFLSERPADIQRFLTASGLGVDDLLERHGDESILAAVIGFVAGDESLATDFSKEEKLKPGQLLTACAAIDPHGSSAW